MGRLDGKVALITGSGSGIGRVATQRFTEEGARVAVVDIAKDAGEQTVELARAAGGDATFVHTDITDEDSVSSMVASVLDQYGQIDVVYNNCGGSSARDGRVHEVPIDEWWRTINVDLFGTFLVSRCAIPAMLERGGAIINTTSAAALVGTTGARSCYTAAKGGIVAMSRAMAATYHEEGIRVNVISPGGTATARVVDAMSARGALPDLDTPRIPPLGQPEDIANAAVYLASDEARMVTGIVLPVDGGATSTRRAPRRAS
jgi:NAD(P)-dependent dehydrogenase (short-subunit alcohol dehydrogenase family)